MLRSLRKSCAIFAVLTGCGPAVSQDALWHFHDSRPARVPVAQGERPALLRLRAAEAPLGAFAELAARAAPRADIASGTPVAVALEPAAPVAAEPAATAVVAAPTVGLTVFEAIAFEAALAIQVKGPALTSSYRPFWGKIADIYRVRLNQPLWRDRAGWSPAARAVIVRLARASDDALTLPAAVPAALTDGSPAELAAQDVALTAAVIAYARQASGDRVDPARLSKLITARTTMPDAALVIAAVATAGNHASEVLSAFNPPHPGYRALRDKLGELRHAETPAAARIPAGPPLKLGMRDDRVKLIRARFGLEIASPDTADDVLYDTRVVAAVAGFQRENGLQPSGVLTPRTVALLSGGDPSRLESTIIANMERWRWLPRDLGSDRIEVDVPSFSLALVRDGTVVHRARVIVGKPTSPTPIFSNAMKHIIVNPAWNIPSSILEKEILPKLAADPDYLRRLGYEMTTRRGKISVRQPPGERNALGRIKFMFPNEHAVYLHDTPSRGLFSSPRRAFSHGCVRVDDPMALAAAVLGGTWTPARVKALVGGNEKQLNLATPLPIHIEYFTATVAPDGRLQFRDDIYGYDAALLPVLAAKN